MRHLKLIALAVLALTAITATTATSALGAQAEGFLPTTKFIGEGKGGKLETLGKKQTTCTGTKILSGTMETDSHGTIDIHLTGCTAFGIFQANSLGDSAGTILSINLWLLCLMNSLGLGYGIWIEPATPTHIEAGGILITSQGGIIGEIAPNAKSLKKTMTFSESNGDSIRSCTGTKGETKNSNATLTEDKGKPESAGLSGQATIEAEDKTTETEIMDG
jgi:hypothetical protein